MILSLQVGITSSGDECARADRPGLYTRLAYYTDWIEQVLNASQMTTENPALTSSQQPEPLVTFACNRNSSCGCGVNDVRIGQSHILDSEAAIPHSWPMLVSIRTDVRAQHTCSGTILSSLFILTAAHCVSRIFPVDLDSVSVAVAIHNRSDQTAMVRRVKRLIIHPKWVTSNIDRLHDIAILELVRPFDLGLAYHTARTCLPHLNFSIPISQYPANNTRLMTVGWSTPLSGNVTPSEMLQQVQILLIDRNHPSCNATLYNGENQLCAGSYDGIQGEFICLINHCSIS